MGNTPADMEVFDQCSQRCDVLSKYKNVQVVLNLMTEDCFGTYYVTNTKGRSQEVHIKEMIDGSYSEWRYGEWDKGTRERRRVCTEPVNGGDPCSALGPPTETCNNSGWCYRR